MVGLTSSRLAGFFDFGWKPPLRIPPFPQIFYPPIPPCFRFCLYENNFTQENPISGIHTLLRVDGALSGMTEQTFPERGNCHIVFRYLRRLLSAQRTAFCPLDRPRYFWRE